MAEVEASSETAAMPLTEASAMATFKSKMRHLEDDWADRIWEAAKTRNDGKGAAWLLPLAALALTGVRPASLERGITFRVVHVDGVHYVEAESKGAKLLRNEDGTPRRGQDTVKLRWRMTPPHHDVPHRPEEFKAIVRALKDAKGHTLTLAYDAEAISTRLRELSRELWPRKTHHVSAVCYRELFSSTAKAAGVSPAELAAAMGHLSTESQGRYASRPRRRGGAVKPAGRPFGRAVASAPVRTDRSPMARFKRASAMKRLKASKA